MKVRTVKKSLRLRQSYAWPWQFITFRDWNFKKTISGKRTFHS